MLFSVSFSVSVSLSLSLSPAYAINEYVVSWCLIIPLTLYLHVPYTSQGMVHVVNFFGGEESKLMPRWEDK